MRDHRKPALDDDILAALAREVPAMEVDAAASSRMLHALAARVQHESPDFRFVHSHEGSWLPLARGVEIKLLRQDSQSRSFLLRMAPNSSLQAHPHALDEESLVLEGEVTVQGVHCLPGDYHFAPAGKDHAELHSTSGCLLYVRGSAAAQRR